LEVADTGGTRSFDMFRSGDPDPTPFQLNGFQSRDDVERVGHRRHQIRSRHRADLYFGRADLQQRAHDLDFVFSRKDFAGQLDSVTQCDITQDDVTIYSSRCHCWRPVR
jgi:hypothetical protein